MSGGAASDGAVAEARALADAAGIVRRDDIATLRVTGTDRIDYLHRMLTQDLAALAPGQACPACLLDPKGRILASLLAWNVGDAVLLELPRAARGAVAPVLEKYVIADDVHIGEALERAVRFDLIGAGAPEALAALGLPPPAADAHLDVELGGVSVRLLHHDLGERPRFVLRVPVDGVEAVLEAIEDCGCVRSCSMDAWQVARIEEAVPAFTPELAEAVLFNEVGLEDHVSFSKGCYPGQEPVVMAKHRGRPPRRLCALTVEAAAVPEAGTVLSAEDKPVGVVTSAVIGVALAGIRALGFVQTAVAEEGTVLDLAGGGTARIDRVRTL